MVDALQRAEVVLRHRWAAADQQHRHALEVGVGDGRHAVGDARAGSGHRNAHATRELRMCVRHVHRGALVAHVDDSHSELRQVVPDRLDVASLQAEHAVNAARDEEAGNDFSNAAVGRGGRGGSGGRGGGGGSGGHGNHLLGKVARRQDGARSSRNRRWGIVF